MIPIWHTTPQPDLYFAIEQRNPRRSALVLAYDRNHARRLAAIRLGVDPMLLEVARTEERLSGSERA